MIEKLSKTITEYSIDVKENERVLITFETENPVPLVNQLIIDITKKGGIPYTKCLIPEVYKTTLENNTKKRVEDSAKKNMTILDEYDSFVTIRCSTNDYEEKNADIELLKLTGELNKEYSDIRVNERKWVLLNYPSVLDAHKAKMTTSEFEKFAFDVMNVDYVKMSEDIKPLKELMEKTDKVRITGPNTDITFSIKGMNAIPCAGEKNIPDGEIYTAPLKTSVNGVITYNTPSPYRGSIYNNVSLTFKDGKIIEATCDGDNEELNKIFDTDEGARYVGEFALGINPLIKKSMGDILFDEKILGSIHFTPGKAYKDAYNGNDSSIHWDMVLIQTPECGGGNIYFDDVLIRENGIFVAPELEALNYDN